MVSKTRNLSEFLFDQLSKEGVEQRCGWVGLEVELELGCEGVEMIEIQG